MIESVRVITELRLRREAQELDRHMLVARLQMRCEHGGQGLDARTLRDWEDRGHTPSPVYRQPLCDYFQVDSIAELGLGQGLTAAANWTWMTPAERLHEVERRQLLRMTVNGFGVCLLPVPGLTAAAQFLGGRRRLDPVSVDTAEHFATHLAATYEATPNPQVGRAAQAHTHTLGDLLKRASLTPKVRTRVEGIVADQACLVGDGCIGAGRFEQADAWFAGALRLARQAGDRPLEAFALAMHAWTPMYGPKPDPAKALEAFEAAAPLHLLLPYGGQAWLFGNLALERASAGDDLGSGRLLEQARTAAARVSRDGAGWGFRSAHGAFSGWDGVRLEAFTGKRLLRLGRPAEAVESLEVAAAGTTAAVRRAGLWVDMTDACVALDDPDRTCAYAMTGMDEADRHTRHLPILQISRARAAFPRSWRTLAPVIELDERLALSN